MSNSKTGHTKWTETRQMSRFTAARAIISEAGECRATDIFKLTGNVYAFDSTTIELCLNAFK